MSKKSTLENLIQVKTALAEKYERLAKERSSKPLKKSLLHRAKGYRMDVLNLAAGRSK